jgi:hypothetical protein
MKKLEKAEAKIKVLFLTVVSRQVFMYTSIRPGQNRKTITARFVRGL